MAYAVLGPQGTFSETAAQLYWRDTIPLVIASDLDQVGQMMISGEVDGALLPIENSRSGWICSTISYLAEQPVYICGELNLQVSQHLMACRPYRWKELEVLISHPVAIQQCRPFINNTLPGIPVETADSTAGAAQRLQYDQRRAACIGSQRAAQLYNLEIIAANISGPQNHTRFIHLGAEPCAKGGGRTAWLLSTSNLAQVTKVFEKHGGRITRLAWTSSWKNMYHGKVYLELDGIVNASNPDLMEKLQSLTRELKYLGSYRPHRNIVEG